MTQAAHPYHYLRSSVLDDRHGRLGLETSGGSTPLGEVAHPRFFEGVLTSPSAAAAGLLAVADVAAARYHLPRPAASLDPVVTANGDRLRFESFSGCGGVHARLDVLESGVDGGEIGHGTTNVDVNVPLRDALGRLGPAEPLRLAVGPEELEVTTLDGPVVEKQVPLPERWLRGFAETQVVAAGFDLRAELPAAEAVRFLRSLTAGGGAGGTGAAGGTGSGRGSAGPTQWVLPAGRLLRSTSRPVPGAVCLPGPRRLVALQRVLRHARALRVYGPPLTAGDTRPTGSAWEVELPGMRLTLTLSPDPARGFSGEGGVLDALASAGSEQDAELVAVLLAWESRIDVAELAEQAGLSPQRVRAALTRLGTSGQVGYDNAEAAFFHRRLPYDAGRAEAGNPRLRAARALVAAGAVRPEADGGALVHVEDHVQRVRRAADGSLGCTCLWWAKYRGGRGPCKHVLAVGLAAEAAATTSVTGVAAR
ncbi:SWIM zinc finger family protein [Streptacidiphilus pinicola]|uniref:SWIM zinc finger family protein n=1 Tax=Streptacidiphilus pinicola TaxID=2219663 RepID=A0A2X0KKU5_9ACTN|nr:SWIM zinc finger family protein [Streptacidiphilus pinicola]RAG87569.1 SWIM zinc finger family protein [Streptacidiphilus pinicola]